MAVAGLIVMGVIVLMVVAPFLFTSQSPIEQDLSQALQPPSPEHFLGTDRQGRDIWARIVYGAAATLVGASLVVIVSASLGVTLGLLSGAGTVPPAAGKRPHLLPVEP